ncbi:MAG: hypothetical protein PF489_13235 [Salinivirgaceae bacterium]|jgi:hypothetical protein|nr:hypothetical protein [Salinivirgaceae bacterium]
MKLNRIIFATFTLLMLGSCTEKQTETKELNDDDRRLYRSEKIGFFTEQLDLSENEAIRFWPLYNAYEQSKDSLWKARRAFLMEHSTVSPNSSGDVLNRFLQFDEEVAQLRSALVIDLQEFLSDDKILTMFYAEHQFKHFILNRIRGRHHDRMPRGRGRGQGRGQGRGRNAPSPHDAQL